MASAAALGLGIKRKRTYLQILQLRLYVSYLGDISKVPPLGFVGFPDLAYLYVQTIGMIFLNQLDQLAMWQDMEFRNWVSAT